MKKKERIDLPSKLDGQKAYKAFAVKNDGSLMCRDTVYGEAIGSVFYPDRLAMPDTADIKTCASGIHACINPLYLTNFYDFHSAVYAVTLHGDCDWATDDFHDVEKVAVRRIEPKGRVSWFDVMTWEVFSTIKHRIEDNPKVGIRLKDYGAFSYNPRKNGQPHYILADGSHALIRTCGNSVITAWDRATIHAYSFNAVRCGKDCNVTLESRSMLIMEKDCNARTSVNCAVLMQSFNKLIMESAGLAVMDSNNKASIGEFSSVSAQYENTLIVGRNSFVVLTGTNNHLTIGGGSMVIASHDKRSKSSENHIDVQVNSCDVERPISTDYEQGVNTHSIVLHASVGTTVTFQDIRFPSMRWDYRVTKARAGKWLYFRQYKDKWRAEVVAKEQSDLLDIIAINRREAHRFTPKVCFDSRYGRDGHADYNKVAVQAPTA